MSAQVIKQENRQITETFSFSITRYRGKVIVSEVQGRIIADKQTGKLTINYSQGNALTAEWEEKK